jgi:hypothetical protein
MNDDPASSVSRRKFLSRSIGVATIGGLAPLVVSREVLGGAGFQAPSDTMRIAAVGIGGMGQAYLEGCQSERIVALCDLDHNFSAKVFDKYPQAIRYHDFRKMFDQAAKNFDAIIIATPDHTHAIILMAALQLGKHIYCAKPVTHTIGDARKVRQALVNAKNIVTKTSAQSSGTDGARSTSELLASGIIGPVTRLHVWSDNTVYPCSVARPIEGQAPPPGMDWDLWLGPAPYRPYHSAYHPFRWRPWWDFGGGTVGDMACHSLHVYFKELQLGAPQRIYGYSSFRCEGIAKQAVETPECQSHANTLTWEFPARAHLPPLQVHWYDGGLKPHRPVELDHKVRMPKSGLLFEGERGKLLAGYSGGNFWSRRGFTGGWLLPEEKFRDFKEPAKTLPRVEDHYGEWVRACKTGSRTVCPLDFGAEMTEMALLGSLALRTGRLLEWDAKNGRVTNDPEANELIAPPCRPGWSV